MSREYQGWLGIDLLVDLRTAEASAELAARFSAGQDFWFKAHGAVLPVTPARAHVTLFQCQGARVDPEESWNTLEAVRVLALGDAERPRGPITVCEIVLDRIGVQHDKYLFWYASRTPLLTTLHRRVLRDVVDWTKPSERAENIRQMRARGTMLRKQELENLLQYGQRYVDRQWMPHITLAYATERFELESGRGNRVAAVQQRHRGFARSVALCTHSVGGRIEEVLYEIPLG